MSVEFINPPGLVRGTYSHVAAVTGGRTLYISGQVAIDESGKVVGTTFEQQAVRVFANLKVALAAGGADYHHIVKMNIFVRDLTTAKVQMLREIRQRLFGTHQPASTLVATPALANEDLMLEIEVVAVIPS